MTEKNKGMFEPDYKFESFEEITIEFLKENNIKTILSDLDATLAPHGEKESPECEEWVKTLLENEIALIIVSNNSQERVDKFVNKYNIVGYGKCKKPKIDVINKNLVDKGLNKETTIFLGDQLFTDMICGDLLKVRTALVNPIPGKENFLMKIKRSLENKIKKTWSV